MSAGGSETFDGVVVATPAALAAELLDAKGDLGGWLGKVVSAPTATLALELDRRPAVEYFGLSFPRVTRPGRTVVAACIEHRKLPGLVPEGAGLVVAYPAPTVAAGMTEAPVEETTERMVSALTEALPGLRDRIRHARLYRFPEGYTLYYPGYLRHILSFDERWVPEGVALAGDYLVAPTVEGAVVSGRRASDRLLNRST
jgi:oxygen-dependent protoporphyrinogen oxidase